MSQNKVMRISFSAADWWDRGQRDMAIRAIRGLPTPSNEYMEDGTRRHKEWEQETLKTGKMPAVFGYNRPKLKTEVYKCVQLLDWLFLSGKVDLHNYNVIIDHKSGSGSPSDSLSKYQLGIYGLLLPGRKIGVINHFNRETQEVKVGIRHLTPKYLDDALNWIISIATDIRASCENASIPWWRETIKKQKELV